MTLPTGILPALLTPFTDGEEVDADAIGPLVEFQILQGVDGLYVGGTSAEAMMMSAEERALALRLVAEAVSGRLPLIGHVGAIATRDALRLTEAAEEAGYAAISSITPYYFPFTREEVSIHYLRLADASSLPLVIYNFPARTAGFTTDELARLLEHPNIAGVKHTSTDLFALERLRALKPEAVIYNGFDEMCLAGLGMGAQGAIGTTYNFMGDLFVALAAEVGAGRMDEARRLQGMANVVIDRLIAFGVLPASKAILRLMGVEVGQCRSPFRPVSPSETEALRSAIAPVLAWRDEQSAARGQPLAAAQG